MNNEECISILERFIRLGSECEYSEFKENGIEPENLGQYISALSNGATLHSQKYGYLFFGIQDKTLEIVGTTFNPKTAKAKGNEELEPWLARLLSPRIDFQMYSFEYHGKYLALIQVPAAFSQPTLFKNIGYVRVGSHKKSLLDYPEKERKLWQRPASEFELQIAKQKVSAADVVALLYTQDIFDLLLKQPYPTTQQGVIEKMKSEKLILQDNGHYNITNLGALLFAKNLADFGLQHKSARIIKYAGKNKLNTEKDQIGQKGYGSGFSGIISFLNALLPSNEVIETALRKEVLMYPLLAIRELVANALVHQDFLENGTSPTIEIYEDRIEISNPGQPLIDTQRFIDSNNTRNRYLAEALRRMGFCEVKGSGIDKVISECVAMQLPAPDFRKTTNQTIAILYATQALKNMDKADKIRAAYQYCCLMYTSNQKMTNAGLRERFKKDNPSIQAISSIIKATLEANLIKLESNQNTSKKFVSYIPFWA